MTDALGLVVESDGRNLRTGGLGQTGTVRGPTVDQATGWGSRSLGNRLVAPFGWHKSSSVVTLNGGGKNLLPKKRTAGKETFKWNGRSSEARAGANVNRQSLVCLRVS